MTSQRNNGERHDGLSGSAIHSGTMTSLKGQLSEAIERKINDLADRDRFDYSSVDTSVATFLRGQADRIRRQCATTVVQVGNALIQAKRYLSHGSFLIWVECEVGITARTAQLYMRAALWVSNKGKTVSNFPPSLIYLLSAPTTPPDFADQIVERAAAGTPFTLATVKEELKEFGGPAENKRQGGPGAATVRPAVRKTSQSPSRFSASDAMTKVVEILARDLPREHFASVRDVLISGTAVDHSELANIVAQAFSAVRE